MHFGNQLTFADSLFLSLISIIVVFAVLALISLIISLVGKMLQEEKPVAAPVNTQAKAAPVAQTNAPSVDLKSIVSDEHKLVATLVATMEANTNDEDKKYKITSIREI